MLVSVFKDPTTKNEKVMIVVSLFWGAKNLKFELGPDNMSVKITFEWPKISFDMEILFKKKDNELEIPNYHPKFTCLEDEIENHRRTIDESPVGTIIVPLPIAVQDNPNTWEKKLVKDESGHIVATLELTGVQKQYTVKTTDRQITF